MTPRQIDLVQASFSLVQAKAEETARAFYARLFELDPSLRAMFRGDMNEQGRKLMQMIGVAVGSLKRLDQILPAVEDLGRRHAGYGVQEEHYLKVGSALIWTLNAMLGEAFTPEVCEAWLATYQAVAGAMQRGAMTVTAAA